MYFVQACLIGPQAMNWITHECRSLLNFELTFLKFSFAEISKAESYLRAEFVCIKGNNPELQFLTETLHGIEDSHQQGYSWKHRTIN